MQPLRHPSSFYTYLLFLFAVQKFLLRITLSDASEHNMATNDISGSLDEDIYLGFWVNRSFDAVHGATLTLDRKRGGLLIAFLALFVSTSGRSIWKILRVFLHFVYSSDKSLDGVHLQRQAILRNTPMALDAAFEFTLIFHAWRRRGANLLRKLLLPAALALSLALAFIVAGI